MQDDERLHYMRLDMKRTLNNPEFKEYMRLLQDKGECGIRPTKIGQKVQTPLGVGLIAASRLDGYGINEFYKVNFISPNMSYQVSMLGKDLKPYKTAHEKLLRWGTKIT